MADFMRDRGRSRDAEMMQHLLRDFAGGAEFRVQQHVRLLVERRAFTQELPDFFQEKRDFFNDAVKGSRFTLRPASGSYFQLLDYSAITDEKDTDFAIRMTKEFNVASIPVSVFYHKAPEQKVLRFCFAKTRETLEAAAERLCKI